MPPTLPLQPQAEYGSGGLCWQLSRGILMSLHSWTDMPPIFALHLRLIPWPIRLAHLAVLDARREPSYTRRRLPPRNE